ncbi:serine/threonine-protein kinase [Metabacillus malikii]|uniref:Serine/threonine-protein kinase n=1 Tax=Metabacillus malikii TaxID=1504265 RepID=A0ABT9ZD08_9BACI|nr:serine/threonine-protein kinase [Metabacillus malikii]MDQ0230129.1 serine/threonine-protein kinase [Metabacillus malikii]
MKEVAKQDIVTITIDDVTFQLQEPHNLSWLNQLGKVFCVFDEQDSGNISFGIERKNKKFFVKYAGAKPKEFTGNPNDAVARLKTAIPIYQTLQHPHLIQLLDYFNTENGGFAAVFEWFEGECLHPHWKFAGDVKYKHPKSPYYRFRNLDITKRLQTLENIYAFHTYVEAKGFVAVDFYDGSILYDFINNQTKICDIDFYRTAPSINDVGDQFWGSDRFKSPEEYTKGSPIDSVTNVYTMGAIAFNLLGGETDYTFSKWETTKSLYDVALKAVEKNRHNRYSTVQQFYEAWNNALS